MIINSIYNTLAARGILWIMAVERIYCPENIIFNLVTKLASNLFLKAFPRNRIIFFLNLRPHGYFFLSYFKYMVQSSMFL